jgi:hypothetical protein
MPKEIPPCWLCDRPVERDEEVKIFPFSSIPFHSACLERRHPRMDQASAEAA